MPMVLEMQFISGILARILLLRTAIYITSRSSLRLMPRVAVSYNVTNGIITNNSTVNILSHPLNLLAVAGNGYVNLS